MNIEIKANGKTILNVTEFQLLSLLSFQSAQAFRNSPCTPGVVIHTICSNKTMSIADETVVPALEPICCGNFQFDENTLGGSTCCGKYDYE